MSGNVRIGFIGQGFIGKNYADDFATRGFDIVRYDLDAHRENKDAIRHCDYVFIAVPTPTTPEGFDSSIVAAVLPLVGLGKVAVIKSTVKVGTTRALQARFPDITIIHSPEFLREASAAEDARNPERNIIGILDEHDATLQGVAKNILELLPTAPYNLITKVENAELIKYAGNSLLYFKVVFANILYDLADHYGLEYKVIREALSHDPRIGPSHLAVSHQGGRGAGGHCLIKDFETLLAMLHEAGLKDPQAAAQAMRDLNLHYLRSSGKDADLLEGVYGKETPQTPERP